MKTPAHEAHEAHMAMRDRASFTKDGLLTDKMRYRKALLLACGGDEDKARQFLHAADVSGVAPTREPSGETMVQREEVVSAWNDLPDALKAHPGLKRLYRALGGGALGDKLPNTGVKEDGRG